MMKRLCSKKDLKGYTKMLSVFINLELEDKDYYWFNKAFKSGLVKASDELSKYKRNIFGQYRRIEK